MINEFHIIDLAETNQVQLRVVIGEERTDAPPTEFSVSIDGSDRRELDWYFLDSRAGSPEPSRSQAVETGLSNLGRLLFESVFVSVEQAQSAFAQAKTQGLTEYGLVVISQRAQFLELPWELMNEPETGYLAAQLQWVVRRSNADALPHFTGASPDDDDTQQFNVLLVSPLPSQDTTGQQSAAPHTGNMAGETLKVLESVDVEVVLDVLRPPSFDALDQHLRDRPGHYHLVHLDGVVVGEQGNISFENDPGSAEAVDAVRVAQSLAGAQVPVVLLTSGSPNPESNTGNAISSLLDAKIPVVVSAAYPLSAPARRMFAESFYPAVIGGQDVAAAVARVRRALMDNPHRPSASGNLVHWDWHLPTVYQTAEYDSPALVKEQSGPLAQPQPAAQDEGGGPDLPQSGSNGLVGRRVEIRQLERLFGQRPVVLLSGNTGVGKTELALGFANWIQKTSAREMPGGVFYTSFEVGAGVERVVHEIGTSIAGLDFADLTADDQREWVVDYLKEPCPRNRRW